MTPTMPHGAKYGFVANTLLVPADKTQYAFDLIGDKKGHNQLGVIISALSSQGLNPQAGIDDAVKNGSALLLVSVQTIDSTFQTDSIVGVTIYLGKNMTNPDFSGTGMFTIDTSQAPATLLGSLTTGSFSSINPVTTKTPVTITIGLPLIPGGAPISLKVNGAHLQFKVAGGKITNGEIHGSVKNSDIQTTIIPAVATLLTGQVAKFPTAAASTQILSIFDVGDGSGGQCTNPDGSKGKAGDKIISTCEVAANSLIQNVLAPDIQVFDANGNYAPNPTPTAKDSLSVGLGFTAVGAKYTIP